MPSPPVPHPIANVIANYGYLAFLALIPVFAVPLYLHLLGTAMWGSVALCLTFQGFLFSLDMALGPLMLRDVARAAAGTHAPSTYRRFLGIYAGAAAAVAVLGMAVLALVASHRSAHAQPIAADTLCALRLALVQFLFQFSNNAAIGYWNGLERQRLTNLRLAAFTLIKHATALTVLATWSASACAYMGAFAFVAAIEFGVNYLRIRREHVGMTIASPSPPPRHDALGFAAAALLGLATAQIDRVYLSLTLPAPDYGAYFLVGIPMLTLFSLQMPIQRAYLPRLATATASWRIAATMLGISAVLIALPSLLLAAFPQFALTLWLHDAELAARSTPTFRLLMLTVAVGAISGPSTLLLLNRHRNAWIGALNAAILLVQATLLITLAPRIGMLAGAIAWLACSLIQLAATPLIWRKFGRSHAGEASAPT